MNIFKSFYKLALLAGLLLVWSSLVLAADSRLPNVILIMTDNHGAWTLGCYGNPDIRTPNIDRLAGEGMLFSRCYSSNAVCSPTRATYLTGLIPSQHGVHCWLKARGSQIGKDAYSTIAEFSSLPEILAKSGYSCGLVGKWHLGDSLRPQEGFTTWISRPHGGTLKFYDAEVIEDGQIRKEPGYLTDFWTDHGIRFIERNKSKPFFLYLAYNGPYGLGPSLLRPARNRHAAYYADKELKSFPREPVHEWLVHNRKYINNIQAIRRFAAELSGVDDGVGRIVDTLKQLDLDDNTLVIFTADQGWSGGHNGIWGMGDHSRPLCTFDKTIQIPLICRHLGRIPSGRRSKIMVSNYDLLPTVLSYLGLADKTPREPELPGRDYSAVLRGKHIEWDNVVYYEFENTRMVRTAEWKYTCRYPQGPNELYHLAKDPTERKNLFDEPEYDAVQKQLHKRLNAFFNRYADSKYDLWRDGGSKSHLMSMPKQPLLRPASTQTAP